MVDVVVDQRCEQVVRKLDRTEVTSEVQVDVFHRNDLGVTTTGGTTLDAEDRAERWLAKCDHRALADLAKTVTETNRGGGLALTRRGGADRRNEDQV